MAEVKNAAQVIFKFGTRAAYDAIKEQALDNALYFISDTGELYKGKVNLAKGHFYHVNRQEDEEDTAAIIRALDGATEVIGDYVTITTAVGETYTKSIYVFDGEGWLPLTSNIDGKDIIFSEELTINGEPVEAGKTLKEILESLVFSSSAETVVDIQGSVDSAADLEQKKDGAKPGDAYFDSETGEVWVFDGEEFKKLKLEVDLSGYVTEVQLNTAIGKLKYIEQITIDDEPVVIQNRVAKLRTFNGENSGLVPVYKRDVSLQEDDSEDRVLNAQGDWVSLNKHIGTLTYKDFKYQNVTEYIDARMEDVTITWHPIE